MKKKTLFPLALFACVCIVMTIINACSKNGDENMVINAKITKFSPSKDQVIPLITEFNQRYENHKAGLKSGNNIDISEAEWTIEAAVNYAFRGEKENLETLIYDSLLLAVDVHYGLDNEILMHESDAFALYDDVFGFVASMVDVDKQLLVADVELKQVSDGVASFRITAVVIGGMPDPCQIYPDDYWYAAAGLGKCNGYTGGSGKDAADKINTLLNCAQLNAWFTNVESKWEIMQYYGPNGEPCFWGMDWTGNAQDCLSPLDIGYWFNLALYVSDEETPPNKSFIRCKFNSDLGLGGANQWFHYYQFISYGIPHPINPED
jgi:hypothetical protein